ncbi:hypothetical protein [Nocardia thraciensis]
MPSRPNLPARPLARTLGGPPPLGPGAAPAACYANILLAPLASEVYRGQRSRKLTPDQIARASRQVAYGVLG